MGLMKQEEAGSRDGNRKREKQKRMKGAERMEKPEEVKMPNESEQRHMKYMRAAIKQAQKAYALGEVPIGCVIVYEDRIIGRGYNRRNTDKNTLSHAEITAIRKASRKLGDWRLEGCTLYVTLEPCQMCSGAIVQARIPEVVIGCMNPKAGCAGSILNILQVPDFNHQVRIVRGIMEEECSAMLTGFFKELRVRVREERRLRKTKEEKDDQGV